tara:strand:+ start:17085 stop:17267 length:183 start_codon:yes stop_codon:yes gene_type:complete
MSKYNHAISVSFEFLSDDEDPVTKENLEALVAAAKGRLERILEIQDLDAFDAYDWIREVD